jgi:molecular chaperone GrpE
VETKATNDDGADPLADVATEPDSGGALEALNAKLIEANARAEENHAKMLYALAEFENFKKRNERMLLDRLAAGKRATLAKFLPVLDNLERALRYEQDSGGLRGGLEATQRGFESLLASEGVKRLTLVGERFDPRIAEAIGTRPADDVDEDVVVEEVQPGYAIGEDVLRPAHVIVAKRVGDSPAA